MKTKSDLEMFFTEQKMDTVRRNTAVRLVFKIRNSNLSNKYVNIVNNLYLIVMI